MEQIEKRLEMLDERLDNIDSILTALVERIMRQPLNLELTCPKCGSVIQITLMGGVRLSSKS